MKKKKLLSGLIAATTLILASCASNSSSPSQSQQESANNSTQTSIIPQESSSIVASATSDKQNVTPSTEASNVTPSNTSESSTLPVSTETSNIVIDEPVEFNKDLDVNKLESANFSLRDKANLVKELQNMVSKVSNINCVSVDSAIDVYEGEIESGKSTETTNVDIYSNNVVEYSREIKVEGNYNFYGPIAIAPVLRASELKVLSSSTPKSFSPKIMMPTKTTNTMYFNENYCISLNAQFYDGFEQNKNISVQNNNYEEFINTNVVENLPTFDLSDTIYKLNDTHFVIANNHSFNGLYSVQVENAQGQYETKQAHREATNKSLIYLSKVDTNYFVDYVYFFSENKSDYAYDYYYDSYTYLDGMKTISSLENTFTFNYDKKEYEDLDDFKQEVANYSKIEDTYASYYRAIVEEVPVSEGSTETVEKVTSVSKENEINGQYEIISQDGNKFNIDSTFNLSTSGLYNFDIVLENTKLNPKVLSDIKASENESLISNQTIKATLDFSKVELPEELKLYKFEDNTYCQIELDEDKDALVLVNYDFEFTQDQTGNTIANAVVNSVEVLITTSHNQGILVK